MPQFSKYTATLYVLKNKRQGFDVRDV